MGKWLDLAKSILLWGGFLFFMYKGVMRIGGAVRGDAMGVIFEMAIAAVYFLMGALCVCGLVAEYVGGRFGSLIYPYSWLKAPGNRLAAAESLIVKKDFAAAQAALEEIIRQEPCNLAAGVCLAKTLVEWKGHDGRTEACAILISQLRRTEKAIPGGSDAVLLLADLLVEAGLTKRAIETVSMELGKGYCRAESALLKRRFDSLNVELTR